VKGKIMDMNKVHQAASEIVTAREFCGDESEPLRGLNKTERKAAQMEAARIWRGAQVDAGVIIPISKEERITINKIIESGE
jgi:hypothetical protein